MNFSVDFLHPCLEYRTLDLRVRHDVQATATRLRLLGAPSFTSPSVWVKWWTVLPGALLSAEEFLSAIVSVPPVLWPPEFYCATGMK